MTRDQRFPLLERERELSALTNAVQAAAAGSGRLVLIEGPAGVGKSALLAAAAGAAAAAGCEVLSTRGDALDAAIGYATARKLFEPLFVRAPPGRRRELLSGAAAWSATALGLAESELGAADEFTAMHGLYWLAANLAERAPLVLVVDDAQWSDLSSLQWLVYLARRLDSLAVSVLVGVRSGESDRAGLALDALAAEAISHTLRPEPLTAPAAATLLTRLYGSAVDPDFAQVCHRWTGGNPLLLSELLIELKAEGVLPQADAIQRIHELVPDKVREITRLRIGRLPAAAIELARALSIFGEIGQLREVGELAGLAERAAEQAADLLVGANLVEPDLPLRFTHPLIRGVVYSDLLPGRRAGDHKRAARILFAGGSSNDRVAAHLSNSRPDDDPWVVERLLEAGTAALERGSASAAVTLLARAAEEPAAPELRWPVLYNLGRAQMQARDFGAVGTLEQAIAVSRDPGQHADAAMLLGRLLTFAGQAQAARTTLEAAIAALTPDDERTLELEAMLIAAARLDHDLLPVAEERTERYRATVVRDSYGGRMLSAQLAYQSVISGAPASAAVALARAALGDGSSIRESPGRPDAYVVAISMLAICGELDEAESFYAEAAATAQAGGRVLDFAIVSGLRCWTSHASGRLRDAELQARDALELASESPELAAAIGGFAASALANVLIDRGALQDADAALGVDRGALADSSASSARDLLFASARLSAQRSDWAGAAAQLETCGRLHERARIVNPALIPWRSERALVLYRLGEVARARKLAGEELALAERFGAPRPIGVALRAAGLIAEGETALELLHRSEHVLADSPAVLDRARSEVAFGAALGRAGQRARARALLRDALDRAAGSGAVLLADETERELAILGSRPHSALLRGVDSLTAAERRVAGMAAQGMTNPQIAQALFVTRATVQSHLHATYRKLGIGSREQLAAMLDGEP